ncbi:LuxR C-terminal-related transcriptional regulator [Kibdelosporangium philippinense]|uniref:LuxR C-terminal-related transcriptional regulator n=1 Tax=Kibdelosporangium philippinense TaxID=211113 RepID=A0ABS8ZT53_9PSEU|nr:LuxR C-terminal-related transcriptional regulator [Kibdelosporangium philippinense]MCE7010895.1 LuxR C-terminal-related transcriptional regulator [Kibdelosporangium philippinense]
MALATRQRGNLPAETTTFVGRKQDLAEVKQLLTKARLVTLTGVGGVGKTRLALRTGIDLRRAFRDGVWLVELADLPNGALVPHTVLEALAVHDETGRDATDVLVEHLRERQVLLILDNCEHLVEACADLVDVLLRAAPGLRVLATSRERLGNRCEYLWPVSPLPLPDESSSPGEWPRFPALTLFGERAAAVLPGFTMTNETQARVAEVCRLLGGIPLAIELSVVQLRVLNLDQLTARLADCYRLPAAATRGGLPRHQTLQAAVEWSFDLCTAAEQNLWMRASVFAGGFDMAAAEQVCAAAGLPSDEMLIHLFRLVDKSVLISEPDAEQSRFRLLEPLRQYGMDRLRESGQQDSVRRRHRDYYLELAEHSEKEWFGPRQAEMVARTSLEHANFRAALDFSLSSDTTAALRLAATLWFYWTGCGMLGEGRLWLGRALESTSEPTAERMKALWVNGYIHTLQGDVAAAVTMLEECRSYAGSVGDEVALAYATHRIGCNALVGDDAEYAKSLFADARERYRRLGVLDSNVMLADIELAIASVFLGELDQAAALCEEACETGLAHGEQWAYAYAIYGLALVSLSRGDLAGAAAHGRECLRIKREFKDQLGIVLAIEILAWTEAAQSNWDRAATMLGAAQRIWQSVGYPMFGSRYFGAPHGHCETQSEQALGAEMYEAKVRHGHEMSLDEAIMYALGEDKTPIRPAHEANQPAALTERELEVAGLIATGLSNRAIAQNLVISQRTAEGHVNRILRKLGFDSRAQVATWVTQTSMATGND